MKNREIIDDLRRGALSPALAARAAKAIEDLMAFDTLHSLDQAEIVRLRRQIEVLQKGESE